VRESTKGRSGSRGTGHSLREAWELLVAAASDLPRQWRPLAVASLLYQAIAFGLLAPLTAALLRLLVGRSGHEVVADTDIALFFFTTRPGVAALLLVSALALAINVVGNACLMTIGMGASRGVSIRVRDAFGHAFLHAFRVLRVTLEIVIRVLALAAPFVLAIGATAWGLLREHDINFYLKEKPPEFWLAVALGGALLVAGTAFVLPRIASWLLATPLLLFEGVAPRRVLRASRERMAGHRAAAAWALAAWAILPLLLPALVWALVSALARATAPLVGGSLALLLVLIAILAVIWGAALLAITTFNAAILALMSVRLYERSGPPVGLVLPSRGAGEVGLAAGKWRLSWRTVAGGIAAAVVLATGAGYLLLRNAWNDRPVLVIAHRGASAAAPENTLAAFRRAIAEGADFVELDVQESSDGVVLVAHDSDLMKIGGSPLKIWESPASELQKVDIGSWFAPEFRDERVPTLAEVLALCKGKVQVDIELKSYGHDQELEERVVELVEAAGVEGQIVTMSLDHDMVRVMRRLRPKWKSGILVAKAIGSLADAPADFLAVQSSMLTRRFARQAHRAGKEVYVWTLNDPARMLEAIADGADGLITDQPGLARQIVMRRASMDESQRLLLALLVRFGARADLRASDDELRP